MNINNEVRFLVCNEVFRGPVISFYNSIQSLQMFSIFQTVYICVHISLTVTKLFYLLSCCPEEILKAINYL